MRVEPPPEVIELKAPRATAPVNAWIFERTGAGGGGNGGGNIPPNTPGTGIPGDVTIDTVTGAFDPTTGLATVEVEVFPPNPIDPFMGCHLYCEIPDQSTNTAVTVGTTPIGIDVTRNAVAVTGAWNPTDIGKHIYVATQQPWDITFSLPQQQSTRGGKGIDHSVGIHCRLYAVSYSLNVENQLVQANQSKPTPNQTFLMVPGTVPSAAASDVTTLTTVTGDRISLTVDVLKPVNVNGKLQTPFAAIVSDTPQGVDGWGYRLMLTYYGTDPTDPKNQYTLTGIMTQAGIVPSGPADGISAPHSFYLETPKDVTRATIWLQAGLVNSAGHFQGNNIVPGITPSSDVVYGSTVGTTDASAIMISTVDQSMSVVNGLFGVADSGITSALLGPGSVGTINIKNLAVTSPLLAALAVAAGNIQSSAVGNPQLAALAVAAGNLQSDSVGNTALQNLAVANANLQPGAVSNSILAPLSVAAANLLPLSVTNSALAQLAVATANLQSQSVTSVQLGNLSVTAAAIAAAAVGTAAIAYAAVGSAQIAALAVQAGNIAALAVGTAAIQQGAITEALIANLAVSAAKIQSATITNVQIANGTIGDAQIGSVNASKITAGTIYATLTIQAPNINGGTITGTTITGTTSINSPTITGGSITGATLVLNLNGVTTSIENFTNSQTWNVGVEVKQNSNGWWSRMPPARVQVSNAAGDLPIAELYATSGGGVLTITGSGTQSSILLQTSGAFGQLMVKDGNALGGATNIVTIDASQKSGSTPTISLNNGHNGIILYSGQSGQPSCNIQPALITMSRATDSKQVKVDGGNNALGVGTPNTYSFLSDYGLDVYLSAPNLLMRLGYDSHQTPFLLMNDNANNQRIRIDSSLAGSNVPVIGIGITTSSGYTQMWQDRIDGFLGYGAPNNTIGFRLQAGASNGGILYLYYQGSDWFHLDANSIRATTANSGGGGAPPAQVEGYFIMYFQGQPKKVPYYSN